jgi:hypothetical protein
MGAGESVLAELSFAAPAQPVPVDFVQVVALDTAGSYTAFASYLDLSAILVPLPRRPGRYAWRVYTVDAKRLEVFLRALIHPCGKL